MRTQSGHFFRHRISCIDLIFFENSNLFTCFTNLKFSNCEKSVFPASTALVKASLFTHSTPIIVVHKHFAFLVRLDMYGVLLNKSCAFSLNESIFSYIALATSDCFDKNTALQTFFSFLMGFLRNLSFSAVSNTLVVGWPFTVALNRQKPCGDAAVRWKQSFILNLTCSLCEEYWHDLVYLTLLYIRAYHWRMLSNVNIL